MKLVVGLGNPGSEYENTRHNVGWWVVDHLADVWRFRPWRVVTSALAADGALDAFRVRLLKPQTYMNLSGDALATYVARPFWSVANDLLVVVDDVALPLGAFRFRARGSDGGHNGLRSVEDALGTREYARLRVGVGGSDPVTSDRLSDFVLSSFAVGESEQVRALLPVLRDGVAAWITDGISAAMNRFPGRPAPPAEPLDRPDPSPQDVPPASD